MDTPRRIIITSALPYANGDIHLGHLVEHFITDFWSRFQKMRGHECLSFCADDTHGAPIMLEAKKQKLTPEELIHNVQKKHLSDFAHFEINYDHYSSTNSKSNQKYCDLIYSALKDKGHVKSKKIEQFYCSHDQMFLPDRFVTGQCPRCQAPDQYGDSCDLCGAVYNPIEIKDPKCSLCKNTPEAKHSEHLFVSLNSFSDYLKDWIVKHTDKSIHKKLFEWFEEGLKDWCLTRDAPYFGFEVPNHPNKFYYVWFDAPIGYLSTASQWCEKNNQDIKNLWQDPSTEIYHNIGKDIIYFHSLFWPVMLKAAGLKTPTRIFTHGMLTVDGTKLSKSKGTFIKASTYLKHLDPSYLRYYFACKLNDSISDLDLNFLDFTTRVNSDLIGKITNIASRGFQMINKHFDHTLGSLSSEGETLISQAQNKSQIIQDYYEQRNFAKAILEIRDIADSANKYFDDHTPWKLIKDDPKKTQSILTDILNLFRIITIYLKPVLPSYANKVESLFEDKPYLWQDIYELKHNCKIKDFKHLLKRIESKQIQKIIEETKEEQKKAKNKKEPTKQSNEQEITIDHFAKIDLRVAKIIKASHVEGAKKLIKLELDVGPLGNRTIFAGIKESYSPEDLNNKLVVVVANLKTRKMAFGESQGMMLAASEEGTQNLWIISPETGAKAGMKVS